MFLGLGHHSFVRGHDQKRDVDAADACQHVLDKALVTRNIDDTDLTPAGKSQPGETQVNGHPSGFLLGQAVGVHSRDSCDQCRFAVVDMTGGPNAAHIFSAQV